MQKFHLTDSDKIDIIRMAREKKTHKEIAAYLGCSPITVSYHTSRLGLHPHKWTESDDEEFIKLFDQGLSFPEIAEATCRSIGSLKQRRHFLLQNGKMQYLYPKKKSNWKHL